MQNHKFNPAESIGKEIHTRKQVIDFFASFIAPLANKQNVLLDWSGVSFVARSAADQWLKEIELLDASGLTITQVNQSTEVSMMLEIVSRTRFSSSPTPIYIPVSTANSADEILSILTRA